MSRGVRGTARPDRSNINSRMRHEDAAEIVIPAAETPDERERCLADPVYFSEHCCACALKHPIPPKLRAFVNEIVRSAKQGGNVLVVLPRGIGKTTLLSCSLLYCVCARIIRFPVLVGCSQLAANSILHNILATIESSDPLLWCFPEIAFPIRDGAGRWQRFAHQHVRGRRTNVVTNHDKLHLPDLDERGATIVARGAGAAVRGLVDADGSRPDWVLIDDPQKPSTARSDTQLDALEKYILEDLRGLAGGDSTISLFVAATPLAPNDIVDRLSKRPDFKVVRMPLVSSWPDNKALWEEYTRLLYGDLVNGTKASHDYYLANRPAMDAGGEVLDPLAYPPTLSSAIERAYYLKATMGDDAYKQEYQLETRTRSTTLRLDAAEVSRRLSLVPRRIVPAECKAIVATIDVGTDSGLHIAVTAYGPGQLASIVDAYRYPDSGPLLPRNLPDAQLDQALTKALVGVVANLCARGRYRHECTGKPIALSAIGIDRGYRTQTIDRVCAYYQRKRINCYALKGVSNQNYRPTRATIGRADDIDLRDYDGVRWMAYNADTLKVQALSAFEGEPLTAGALSLWGDNSADVYAAAQEIAGEQLLECLASKYGQTYRWAPSSVGAQNHYLDAVTMNLGLANWLRYRQPATVQQIADSDNGGNGDNIDNTEGAPSATSTSKPSKPSQPHSPQPPGRPKRPKRTGRIKIRR